jgi:hypothetical protein
MPCRLSSCRALSLTQYNESGLSLYLYSSRSAQGSNHHGTMLFCRSRSWNKQSTLPSCLHSVWLTTGVTHDQFACEPDVTRASRVIRHRPGYASLVHSFTMLFNIDHRGATALDGSTPHSIRCCILRRLVPVDTSTGSNGRHCTTDCIVQYRWCHGTLLISSLLINSDGRLFSGPLLCNSRAN